MLSGRRLDLLDPSPLDVEVQDIVHGLARVARWNGQTKGPYAFSVAQHSIVVEQIFTLMSNPTPDEQMIALLHDGPEYVVGDMISPFKTVIGDNYKSIEKRLESAIHLRYGLPPDISPELKKKIKKADQISAYFEAILLAGFSDKEARSLFGQPKNITKDQLLMEPLPIDQVETLFNERFEQIDSERKVMNNTASTKKDSR